MLIGYLVYVLLLLISISATCCCSCVSVGTSCCCCCISVHLSCRESSSYGCFLKKLLKNTQVLLKKYNFFAQKAMYNGQEVTRVSWLR